KGLTGFSRRPSANRVRRLEGREAKARATARQKQRRQWSRRREAWRRKSGQRRLRKGKQSRSPLPNRADKGANPKGLRSSRRRNGTARPGSRRQRAAPTSQGVTAFAACTYKTKGRLEWLRGQGPASRLVTGMNLR